jgi:parvulin-like peptidyl-prolyl isomerase
MRLSTVLFILLVPPALAQSTPGAGGRPVPRLVLTNSMDAITGAGVPNAGRKATNTAQASQTNLPSGVPTTGIPLVPSGAVPAPGKGAPEAESGDVWATGEGVRVTASAVNAKVSRGIAEAAVNGKILTEREIHDFRARTLNTMVFVQLVLSQANAADTNRARFETKSRIDGIIKNAPSEEEFWKAVAAAGYPREAFLAEKFEEALVVTILDRNVKSKVKIPDADVRRYYEEDLNRWRKPEQVKAAQIFFATITPDSHLPLPADAVAAKRKKADETLARLKAGGDFAAIAKEASEDPASKERGGEYVIQRKQMFEEFDKAAWSLKPGEISEVVATQFGFHIFKVIEPVPARVIPFEEVEGQIREMLVQREMEVRIPEYGDRLKTTAGIRISASAPRPMAY